MNERIKKKKRNLMTFDGVNAHEPPTPKTISINSHFNSYIDSKTIIWCFFLYKKRFNHVVNDSILSKYLLFMIPLTRETSQSWTREKDRNKNDMQLKTIDFNIRGRKSHCIDLFASNILNESLCSFRYFFDRQIIKKKQFQNENHLLYPSNI